MVDAVPAGPEDPAFVVPFKHSVLPLTYSKFQTFLKSSISAIGLDASLYSTHSFRRGGACTAFELQAPTELIQFTGDWKSECYKRYLHLTLEQKTLVSKLIRDHVNNKYKVRS